MHFRTLKVQNSIKPGFFVKKSECTLPKKFCTLSALKKTNIENQIVTSESFAL